MSLLTCMMTLIAGLYADMVAAILTIPDAMSVGERLRWTELIFRQPDTSFKSYLLSEL